MYFQMTPLGQGEMGNEGISSISKPWPLLAFGALYSAGSAVKSAGFLMLFSITYFKDDVIDFQKQQGYSDCWDTHRNFRRNLMSTLKNNTKKFYDGCQQILW